MSDKMDSPELIAKKIAIAMIKRCSQSADGPLIAFTCKAYDAVLNQVALSVKKYYYLNAFCPLILSWNETEPDAEIVPRFLQCFESPVRFWCVFWK